MSSGTRWSTARQLSCSSVTRQRSLGQEEEQGEEVRPSTAQMASMLDLGCRSVFNNDHDMFRDTVRRFMKERLEPQQVAFEEAGQPSREIWLEMGAQVRAGQPRCKITTFFLLVSLN